MALPSAVNEILLSAQKMATADLSAVVRQETEAKERLADVQAKKAALQQRIADIKGALGEGPPS